jgi:anti-sigma regulatory factor (Ser/Thr protein kinase)
VGNPTRGRFDPEVRELRRMSAWWREWAALAVLPAQIADDGELCLNEVAANIIRHGEDAGGVCPIEITLEHSAGMVRITVVDGMSAFNPLDYPPVPPASSLEGTPVAGLGIHLIRAYASDLHYRREDGRNVLTLTLPSAAPGPVA